MSLDVAVDDAGVERSGNKYNFPATDIYTRGGCRARSKALDLGSSLAGVQGFESLSPHCCSGICSPGPPSPSAPTNRADLPDENERTRVLYSFAKTLAEYQPSLFASRDALAVPGA